MTPFWAFFFFFLNSRCVCNLTSDISAAKKRTHLCCSGYGFAENFNELEKVLSGTRACGWRVGEGWLCVPLIPLLRPWLCRAELVQPYGVTLRISLISIKPLSNMFFCITHCNPDFKKRVTNTQGITKYF